MTESFWIDILSGANRTWVAALLRSVLWCLAPVYALITTLRNLFFDTGILSVNRVDAPVISIGNITTGGTGKTPTVAWIVKALQDRGHSPGIVSRGYRTLDGAENDEKRLLDQMFPDVPHQQHRKRFEAAQSVLKHPCHFVVLDDGFQHRKLHRDLNIVLIDTLNPFGYGHLLPRGLLRERLTGLQRADVVLLTRCDLVGAETLAQIKQQVRKQTQAEILETEFRATGLVNSNGVKQRLEYASEYRLCAFCGIGNPNSFRRTLAALGAPVSEQTFKAFPDHHHYTDAELDKLAEWAAAEHAEILIVTRKDLVKIQRSKLNRIPIWAVEIELTFRESSQPLESLIDKTVALMKQTDTPKIQSE